MPDQASTSSLTLATSAMISSMKGCLLSLSRSSFQMLEKEEHLRKKARSERETAAALTKVMSSDLQKAVETKMSDGK